MYYDGGIEGGERTCSTLLQCFMTTFNYVSKYTLINSLMFVIRGSEMEVA